MAISQLITPYHHTTFTSIPFHTSKIPNITTSYGSYINYKRSKFHDSLSKTVASTPAAAGIWDALTGNNNAREAVFAIRRGMLLFREGDVLGSLLEFDKAIELDPGQKAYLWQRGLSLYYLDRFEEGAEQFRIDVAQNPNDTEESIWCFLCESQLYGVDEARRRFLEVGKDSRPYMRDSYEMFKDSGDPEKLVARYYDQKANEYFYASLYAGLYYESQNEKESAKHHIIAACLSPYGSRSDDYMASLAKVHCKCRNWS